MNKKAGKGEGTFLRSQERGCRTGGSRNDGNTPTNVKRSRTGVMEVWCYLICAIMTEEEANGPEMEMSKDT